MARILGSGVSHGLNPIPASGFNVRVIPEQEVPRGADVADLQRLPGETDGFVPPDMAFPPDF